MNKTGIIVLAAGSSSRFGRPKQILPFQNKTLIQNLTQECVKAGLFPIVIITGAHAAQVSEAVNNYEAEILYNKDWVEGMASGIVAGITKMLDQVVIPEDVIISVCDQPFLSAELFLQLKNKRSETGKGIVACTYADTMGTPVLFKNTFFKELLELKGEEGAKKLLKLHKADVATVSFPKGSIDIDTEEDYQNLLKGKHQG